MPQLQSATYDAALSAAATAANTVVSSIAAVGVFVYVILTYRLWRETQRTNEATLMSQLMAEYDAMRDAVRAIDDYYRSFPDRAQALEEFRKAYRGSDRTAEIMGTIDESRFRLSGFFIRVRKLSVGGFLSTRIIMSALGRAAINDVFLNLVAPLDDVISLESGQREAASSEFFREIIAGGRSLAPAVAASRERVKPGTEMK